MGPVFKNCVSVLLWIVWTFYLTFHLGYLDVTALAGLCQGPANSESVFTFVSV